MALAFPSASSASPAAPASPASAPSLLLFAVAVAALLLTAPAPARAANPVTDQSDCHLVPAQTELNYSKMRGTWYVVEIAEHLPTQAAGPRAPVTKAACPQVDLWPPTQPTPDPRIALHWREAGQGVLYDLHLPEPSHKGYWVADKSQNGSLTTEGKYRQFTGAVLVLKATSSHAVLTFCEVPGTGRLVYSVVLAREPQLPHEDLNSLNEMLKHRGLPLAGLQRTCKDYRSAAPAVLAPLPAAALALVVFATAAATQRLL